jgi:hypothetical protein
MTCTNYLFETRGAAGKIVSVNGKLLLPVLFVMVFALSRIPGLMPWNFSVAYALAFCSGVFFPGKRGWLVPLGSLLLTDIGLNFYYQYHLHIDQVWSGANIVNLLFNYAGYVAIIALGRRFRPGTPLVGLVAGGILGAILFYLITNTASWLFNPFHSAEYVKTLSGWILALTKGINGYPSTWEFFRNTLLSGALFTALFGAAGKLAAESPADKTAGAREPQADGEAAPEPEEANA